MSMLSQNKLATLQHVLSSLLLNNDLIVLVDNKKLGATNFGTFLECSV